MNEPTPGYGLCECGCGRPTKIATETDTRYDTICGFPRRFARGHGSNRKGRDVTVGQRFGRGVVIDPEIRVTMPSGREYRGARLRCDCGVEYEAPIERLISGDKKSCGCGYRQHGLTGVPLFEAWRQIIERCDNPRSTNYPNYGGRGITICDRWRDPVVFISDIERLIGPRPPGRTPGGKPVYTLDRIDNDGHYEPGNVKWSTPPEQSGNKRLRLDSLWAGRDKWLARREYRTEVCEWCGGEFQTRHNGKARFCSEKCGHAKRVADRDDLKDEPGGCPR